MYLKSLKYSEYEDTPKYWELSEATFSNVNLVVGRNSTGKSRLLAIVNNLAAVLTGKAPVFDSGRFDIQLDIDGSDYSYSLYCLNGAVVFEELIVDGSRKYSRNINGYGKIKYEFFNQDVEFKIPPDLIVAANKRDELQHPYLSKLHEWAKGVVLYSFGSDFGKRNLMGAMDVETRFSNGNMALIEDPDNLVGVYASAYQLYGEEFDKSIIRDMSKLGYDLDDVGADNLQSFTKFPFAAFGIFVSEKDLGFKNPQTQLSQGMFRALALAVHLNVCAFSHSKHTILVDDIGEGLDYERATAVIDLLIEKSRLNELQIIMTSNDRFVMNHVPLEFWSLMKRSAGKVSVYNYQNSQKTFDEFKYVGLNNFEFFASDFIDGCEGDSQIAEDDFNYGDLHG